MDWKDWQQRGKREGKRARGRQRTSYMDDIKEVLHEGAYDIIRMIEEREGGVAHMHGSV